MFVMAPQNRIVVFLYSLVIISIFISTSVFCVEQEKDELRCSVSSSLRNNLDAADSVMSNLQTLIVNARSKTQNLEGTCLGPDEKSALRCTLSASMRSNLDAADSVMTHLQKLVVNARNNILDLEGKVCPERKLERSTAPVNCYEVKQRNSSSVSGIYKVWPKYLKEAVAVYCDMETEHGGWTVFQRRDEYVDHQEDFFRNKEDYKRGFGDLNREFWLGNDAISALSFEVENVLRVELEDFDGNKRYALYTVFRVAGEEDEYRLRVSGYNGDAGDSLRVHDGRTFSTKDFGSSCASQYKGAWWYNGCHESNLNGLYLRGKTSVEAAGVVWLSWLGYKYSLKKTEMKMKPKMF